MINKPFYRTYRPVDTRGSYSNWAYIEDQEYARAGRQYVTAFLILQSDIESLFRFIEPADTNLHTFSFKIHELLIRTCIEVEANFKAILLENDYTPKYKKGNKAGIIKRPDSWSINDYVKVNKSHFLDQYRVRYPFWRGSNNCFIPFAGIENSRLDWYKAYNESKHNRIEGFEKANFYNLLNSFAGLFALLCSQFRDISFHSGPTFLQTDGVGLDGFDSGIGGYLQVKYPKWEEKDLYTFQWEKLEKEDDRFQKFNFN